MIAQWICDFVGRLHQHRVTITQLSKEMGVTREYLSMILNGHREPPGIESRMNNALDNVISRMQKGEMNHENT